MTRLLMVLVLLVLAGYGLSEAWPLLSGPALAIASPAEGASAASGLTLIEGHTKRAVALTLDGMPVLPDQNGNFTSKLAFPAGTSILTFVAVDRFGRSVTKTRTVYTPALATTTGT